MHFYPPFCAALRRSERPIILAFAAFFADGLAAQPSPQTTQPVLAASGRPPITKHEVRVLLALRNASTYEAQVRAMINQVNAILKSNQCGSPCNFEFSLKGVVAEETWVPFADLVRLRRAAEPPGFPPPPFPRFDVLILDEIKPSVCSKGSDKTPALQRIWGCAIGDIRPGLVLIDKIAIGDGTAFLHEFGHIYGFSDLDPAECRAAGCGNVMCPHHDSRNTRVDSQICKRFQFPNER